MSDQNHIVDPLKDIRDGQTRSLELQQQLYDLASKDVEQRQSQIERSLALQHDALARQRQIIRLGLPLIVACIGLIAYLIVRYF